MTTLIEFDKRHLIRSMMCIIKHTRVVEINGRALLFSADLTCKDIVHARNFATFALKRRETISILGCTSYLNRLQTQDV